MFNRLGGTNKNVVKMQSRCYKYSSGLEVAERVLKSTLNSGLKIPSIGVQSTDPEKVKVIIRNALSLGYRHFDCAHINKNEEMIGDALLEGLAEFGLKREDIWLSGKLWNTFHHPDLVFRGCELTLKNLKTDYLDLYSIHWPVDQKLYDSPNIGGDPQVEDTPLWETYHSMIDLQKKGLTKSTGVCNFTIEELKSLIVDASFVPEVNQVELHPYLCQTELIEYCKSNGIVVSAYIPQEIQNKPQNSPLSSLLEHPLVCEIAKKVQMTPLQTILCWAYQHKLVVVSGFTALDQITQALEMTKLQIPDKDFSDLNNIEGLYRFVKPSFRVWND